MVDTNPSQSKPKEFDPLANISRDVSIRNSPFILSQLTFFRGQ